MKNILLICMLSFCALIIKAQDPYYITIDKSKGLPSNSVYDIFQDSKGFIWIAHNNGLSRYDGYEFKTYVNNKQTSKSGTNIKEDKYGRIWYQNFDGYLYYVEHDSLKALKQNTALGFLHYGILDSTLIVACKEGFDLFDVKTLNIRKRVNHISYAFGGGIANDSAYYIYANKLLVLNSSGALDSVDMAKAIMTVSKNGLLLVFTEHIDDYCYELSKNGLTKKFIRPKVKYIQKWAYTGGYYWFCSSQGVWAYDEEGHNINGEQPFFRNKSISCVLKDREGNYWIGSDKDGIMLVPELDIKLKEGIIPNRLLHVQNTLLIGTKNNEIYAYDLKQKSLSKKFEDTIRHEIIFIYYDTSNGKTMTAAQNFKILDKNYKPLFMSDIAIKEVNRISDKYYAVSTSGSSGFLLPQTNAPDEWDNIAKKYPSLNSIMSADFATVTRGRSNVYAPDRKTIYFGTAKGLYYVTPKTIGLINYNGQSIYPAKMQLFKNELYILTTQNSLYKVDKDNIATEIKLAPTASQLYNIKQFGKELYLLTNTGILILDTSSSKFASLKVNFGISNDEINDLALVDDQYFIASDRGLLIVDKNKADTVNDNPVFHINSLSANGATQAMEADPSFNYDDNDIQISYSILSFKTLGRYPLYYKINNGKWQLTANESRMLKLASLAPGSYEIFFQLGEPVPGNKIPPQSVRFIIKKPLWLEWWFLLACAFLISGIAYAYYKWQTGLLKKKNTLLVEKVQLEKNLRSSMLTAIKSQMNPHFFYNALNTIQSYIFSDDKRSASTYLSKFSKLTRMILEMSEKETVSLQEEISALQLYLDLEKARFNDELDFSLTSNDDKNTELIRLPSMIVQPYVENSIKHGLLHKKGAKVLKIDFSIKDANLCICIDDNGIGRRRSEEMNRIRTDKHASFATEANLKRIEILNKGNNNIGVKYIDKTDPMGQSLGTTVMITIPLIKETQENVLKNKSYNN